MKKIKRIVFIFLLIVTIPLIAQDRDQTKEQKYYKELEQRAPEAVEHFRKGTEAMDRGDTETAELEFNKVLNLARDFAPALRRLSYITTDTNEALILAQKAVAADNHVYNRLALVSALINMDKPEQSQKALETIQKCLEEIPNDIEAHVLFCQAALATNKMYLFANAVDQLKKLAPNLMVTHYFSGIVAAFRQNWILAEEELLKAKELGLPKEAADKLLNEFGISASAKKWRFINYSIYIVLIWAISLSLLLGLGLLLSKLTMTAINKMGPEVGGTPTGWTRSIRRIYKSVLAITSLYFYISIPIVMLLVITIGGGVIYLFFAVGRIPIQIMIFILVTVFATLWAMIKSLFTRPKKEDPGKPLYQKDAPELFSVLEEVAQKVNTRMIDIVFLAPGADIAVFEKGSLFKRIFGKNQSCLILGMGALKGLSQLQFKSILAHEFGHLNNKDTAGGALALHVRRSIISSIRGLLESGTAKFYNPAWLFINAFHRIFLRISQGASRLQEVIADRFATLAYGATAFALGLTHIIRRGIEFNIITNVEAYQARFEKRKFNNLYIQDFPEMWPQEKSDSQDEKKEESTPTPTDILEKEFKEAMETPTSPYDSHPAPKQRIQWVERIQTANNIHDDGAPALELFNFSPELQMELSKRMQNLLMQNSIQRAMDEAYAEENYNSI